MAYFQAVGVNKIFIQWLTMGQSRDTMTAVFHNEVSMLHSSKISGTMV